MTNYTALRTKSPRGAFRLWVLSGTAMIACSGVAHAQGAATPADNAAQEAGGLSEIVVTARRTSENVQTTPVSVTAVSSEQIKTLNITRLDNIQQLTPNLNIQNGPSSVAPILFLRGIGSGSVALYSEPPVGLYIDGVYTPRPTSAAFDLPDLAGAEVLRGPQGTLFGRNTTGGAILIRTTPPQAEAGGQVRVSYGSDNDLLATAVIHSGQLGENGPRLKLVLQNRDRDGWVNFPGFSKSEWGGSLHTRSAAFTMAGDLTPSLSFDTTMAYSRLRSAVGFQTLAVLNPAVQAYFDNSPSLGGPPAIVSTTPLDIAYRSPVNQDNQATIESFSDRITFNYDGGKSFQAKSITGYSSLNENLTGQLGGSYILGPVNRLGATVIEPVINHLTPSEPGKQNQFSQEFNFTGTIGDFSYIAGLYYFQEHVSETIRTIQSTAPTSATSPITLTDRSVIYSGNTKSYAGYGQVSYKPQALDGKLEISGGIRFTRDEKDVASFTTATSSATGITTLTGTSLITGLPGSGTANIAPSVGSASWQNVGWSGSVSYAATPSIYLFARASSAFRAGGFNAGSTNAPPYAPETAISYEGGIKSEWFDRHVRLNIVGFYTNYDGLQINQYFGPPRNTNFISNAGDATYKGVEVEFAAQYGGLSVDADFGRIWPKYGSYIIGATPLPAICTTSPNDPSCFQNAANVARFGFLAETSFHAGVQYASPETPVGVFTVRADFSYRSSFRFSTLDLLSPNNLKVDSGGEQNLSARLIVSKIPVGGKDLTIQVFGENLLNYRSISEAIDLGTTMNGIFNRPRNYGVILTQSF